MGDESSRLAVAASTGIRAVRENARPFLLVQAVAVSLAVAYYVVPGASEAMAGVARAKASGGLWLSALCTAFAGAILPELARRATGRAGTRGREMAFQLVFFGFTGVLIDLTYQVMALVFGQGADFGTVTKKVLADQLVFAPFVSIPLSTFIFGWHDNGFSLARTANSFRAQGGFLVRYLSTLVTCWGFWAPVLVAVYAMPSDLQFPLFLAAQAAWSLLLLHLNDR